MNCHKRIFSLIVLITVIAWGGMAGAGLAADNRGHGVPADALPKELKNVDVKDYFLPGRTKEAGVIQTAMGHVVVARGDLRQAYFAASGDKLYEQDVVFTLKASKCRIKLINNDVITLGDRTRITIKEVAGEINKAEKKTNLSMAQGKAMFYAIRVLSQKGAAMTVESPTTVAGVRGTKFGMEVAVEGEENNTASLPLLLADASEDWGRHLILAQAPPTPNITTTVHGFDGTVTVTSTVDGRTQSVGAGQTVSATPQGVGAVLPTPPQVAQRFQAATDVPPPASGGSSSSSGSGGSSSSQSSSSTSTTSNTADAKTTNDNTGTSNTNTPDTSNITQQQNVNKEEEKAVKKETAKDPVTDPKTNASDASGTSRSRYGYFASMLSNTTSGSLEEVFASQNRYDSNSNVWARGTKSTGTDYTRVLGNSGLSSNATLKWVMFDSGTKNSGELSLGISDTTMGQTANMEWGYATVPTSFTVDNTSYAFNNRVYYLFGSNIPTMSMLSGSATYSGNAYGTYWSAAGGANMTGSFSTDVLFSGGSASLSNFGLSVSGNGASASISNASGTIGSDANFALTGGTWNLNGIAPDQYSAVGSLYGSTGANMGGVWAMYSSAYKTGAVGSFVGDKTTVPAMQYKGHMAGMLEKSGTGYWDTYLSTYRQDFSSTDARAYSNSGSNYAKINGTGETKNIEVLQVAGGDPWSGTEAVTYTSKKTGTNAYMDWGTWTQANAMVTSNGTYYFKNEGAYVWGTPTTDAEMSDLRKTPGGQGVYSGDAWGTYFSAGNSGTPLTGSFSGTVNFTTPTITNFSVNVSGGVEPRQTVSITNATGSFTGTTSSFVIDTNTGTWKIGATGSEATAGNKSASGTIYGNTGQYIGGVWKAGSSATNQAVGGFQGSK